MAEAGTRRVFYRILDPSSGLYSAGGSGPRWTRRGKVWTAGTLKQHMLYVANDRFSRGCYDGAVVLECEVVETEAGRKPASEWLQAAQETRVQRRSEAEAASCQRQEQEERALYEQLKRRFGEPHG